MADVPLQLTEEAVTSINNGVMYDAQAGVEALMQSGIGTMVQFGLLVLAVILSIGSLFMVGLAGMSYMSQDSGRQNQVGSYAKGAGVMLACAAILGAGPAVLTALGFETMQYIDPINVFSG